MAERRMFAKTIIDSDAFLDMPCSAQCLYFHLAMRADDDGFVNNPRKIQRMVSSSADDLRLLAAKKFIIPFDSGLVVIKHWRIHNYIQKDRYKETVYQDEKKMLSVNENNSYSLIDGAEPLTSNVSSLDTGCIHDVSNLEAQVRLGKVSKELGKDRLETGDTACDADASPRCDYDAFKNTYNSICINLPSCKVVTDKRKKAIKAFLKDFTPQQWEELCGIANSSKFLTGHNDRGWKANIDFLLRTDKAANILEGVYADNGSTDGKTCKKKSDFMDFYDYGERMPDADELAAVRRMMEE